jgi:DNA-binding NtrC family response regulator
MSATVLIVDDESTLLSFLERILSDEGYETLSAATIGQAEEQLETRHVDIMLLDLALPDGNGLSLLERITRERADLPVIVLTAYGAVNSAVQAMKLGAFDYLTKPFDAAELLINLSKAGESVALRRELEQLRQKGRSSPGAWTVGETPLLHRLAEQLERVAPTAVSILITGESGSGKEVLARTIHARSPRATKAFMAINCAAIPDHLLESELFGYEAGAFTGAKRQKKGLIEMADGGTLFLDEIGSMKLEMQAKLLRVLETKSLIRVGGTGEVRVNIRLMAATNRDLAAAVKAGAFREDLYYRLSVVQFHLPPLRERIVDLPLFLATFLEQANREMGKRIISVHPRAMAAMKAYAWPGNIRELRNVIERAVLFCDGPEIELSHLPAEVAQSTEFNTMQSGEASMPLHAALAEYEVQLIDRALAGAGGDEALAADRLGLSVSDLRERLATLNGA